MDLVLALRAVLPDVRSAPRAPVALPPDRGGKTRTRGSSVSRRDARRIARDAPPPAVRSPARRTGRSPGRHVTPLRAAAPQHGAARSIGRASGQPGLGAARTGRIAGEPPGASPSPAEHFTLARDRAGGRWDGRLHRAGHVRAVDRPDDEGGRMSRLNTQRARRGFTVTEVVIAFLVLATTMLIVAQLGVYSLRARDRSEAQHEVAEFAANVLEAARAEPWDALTPEWAAGHKLSEAL